MNSNKLKCNFYRIVEIFIGKKTADTSSSTYVVAFNLPVCPSKVTFFNPVYKPLAPPMKAPPMQLEPICEKANSNLFLFSLAPSGRMNSG